MARKPNNRPQKRERQAIAMALQRGQQAQQNITRVALAGIAAATQASNNMAAPLAASAKQGAATANSMMAMAPPNMQHGPTALSGARLFLPTLPPVPPPMLPLRLRQCMHGGF